MHELHSTATIFLLSTGASTCMLAIDALRAFEICLTAVLLIAGQIASGGGRRVAWLVPQSCPRYPKFL